MATVTAKQAAHWIGQLHNNLLEHCVELHTPAEHLQFLSDQYAQLNTLNLAIRGKVIFVGTPRQESS